MEDDFELKQMEIEAQKCMVKGEKHLWPFDQLERLWSGHRCAAINLKKVDMLFCVV